MIKIINNIVGRLRMGRITILAMTISIVYTIVAMPIILTFTDILDGKFTIIEWMDKILPYSTGMGALGAAIGGMKLLKSKNGNDPSKEQDGNKEGG